MQDDVVQDLRSLLITHYFIDLLIEIVPIEVGFGSFTVVFAVIRLLWRSLDKTSFSRVCLLSCSNDIHTADLGVGLGTRRTIIISNIVLVGSCGVA